ncbi:MAG: bifunctional 5,10-methylenetetrahydrofolate dehydrogenase/5,10-methenyltetrahydrofolate cyclohydrolase [Deltaproteobacteria bacterium]|nr:bifunctional 5,10-methylenetetrahydrofolate dehydrogenase/5,10-methenyltetrahydrofolate cyclohydrolase [Deltaproteobacteria bacterium]
MAALVISGKELAQDVLGRLKSEVASLTVALGRKPHLAVVLVGEDPASRVYVKTKTAKALSIGMETTDVVIPGSITNESLQAKLAGLSAERNLDGILLQLPLPNGIDELAALRCIDPSLDVDGLHPLNQGLLLRTRNHGDEKREGFKPCTPLGVMALIDRAREELGLSKSLDGLKATVVGRSVLVGKPVAMMLVDRNCTVSLCHSKTLELDKECRQADILVAAVGRPKMIKSSWIKPHSIVIDVGINRTAEGELVGDVDFIEASEVAQAITPVPGGVGPMTIAMLLANTVESARRKV